MPLAVGPFSYSTTLKQSSFDEPLLRLQAAELLAELLQRETNCVIDADDILAAFEKHWARISMLAHAIHEGK